MNKMLKISLVAVLAAMPLLAHGAAANVDKQPATAAEGATGIVATTNPKYAIMPSAETDSNVATAGYVKGAYNASIRAINKVSERIDDIDGTLENLDGLATKDGVVETINTSSASYTPAGTVADVTIDAMNEWGSDEPGTITVPGGTFTGTAATIVPKVTSYTPGPND
jgi:hypothetical protein